MRTATTEETSAALIAMIRNPPRAEEGALASQTPCYECINAREVPGNAHILCAKPCAMTGDPHGIRKGWFMYPLLFDPTWRTSECPNFTLAADSGAVSPAISHPAQ